MFHGSYTALVTPFTASGDIDTEAFVRLVEAQIEAGVDGIVPAGTTGESATLTMEEHLRVIELAIEAVGGRVKVIAGTGSNSTDEAIRLTREAMKAGADASLQVTPYYNRPNQEGLARHFSAIADLGLPIVLYNVPSRTGREIEIDTVARLSAHPNVVAIKEAGGSVSRVSDICARCDITVLSGDDALTLPMMAVGAKGCISVATNILPRPVTAMIHAALDGRWDRARRLHGELHDVFRDLFLDVNPIPVKAALAMLGAIEESYRLPLVPLPDTLKERLLDTLQKTELKESLP